MKKSIVVISFVLITLPCFAQITGKVISIADGDTFTLLTADKNQIKIRLYGIDCPETGQDFSKKAKQATADYIFNKYISVYEKSKDKYGITIGIAMVNDSVSLNELLLQAGMAWHYKEYDKSEYYARLEQYAKDNKLGLWNNPLPTAPWDYRKGNRYVSNTGQATTKVKESTVLICNSKSAYAYHSRVCSGLSRCRSGVQEISVSTAKSRGYRPCKICGN